MFNLSAISAHECHDERFGYMSCFGRFERVVVSKPPTRESVVQSIMIHPVGRPDGKSWREWQDYASRLLAFLNDSHAEPVYKIAEEPELPPGIHIVRPERQTVHRQTPQPDETLRAVADLGV